MTIEPEAQATNALEDSFEKLRAAEIFEGFPVGGMGQKRKNYEAFARLYRAGASAGRDRIEDLLARAKPAGKLYAALLLRRLDESAGRRALEGLRDDDTEIVAVYDCTPDASTVGSLASQALSGQSVIDMQSLEIDG